MPNRIREIIQARGQTFDEVADAAGISRKTLYNAANGMKSNRSTRKLIAQALKKPERVIWPVDLNYCSNNQEAV